MEMKLFLRNINQDHIGRALPDGGWDGNVWKVSCCVVSPAGFTDFGLGDPDPMSKGLVFRKEAEGGIFWEPKSGAVYSVDEQAYHAILELDRGVSEREVARRLGVSRESVQALVDKVRRVRSGERVE